MRCEQDLQFPFLVYALPSSELVVTRTAVEAGCVERVRRRDGLACAGLHVQGWSARTPVEAGAEQARSRRGDRQCAHVHVRPRFGSQQLSDLVRSSACWCACWCACAQACASWCACWCAAAIHLLVANASVCIRKSFPDRRACCAPAPRLPKLASAPSMACTRRHARVRLLLLRNADPACARTRSSARAGSACCSGAVSGSCACACARACVCAWARACARAWLASAWTSGAVRSCLGPSGAVWSCLEPSGALWSWLDL